MWLPHINFAFPNHICYSTCVSFYFRLFLALISRTKVLLFPTPFYIFLFIVHIPYNFTLRLVHARHALTTCQHLEDVMSTADETLADKLSFAHMLTKSELYNKNILWCMCTLPMIPVFSKRMRHHCGEYVSKRAVPYGAYLGAPTGQSDDGGCSGARAAHAALRQIGRI